MNNMKKNKLEVKKEVETPVEKKVLHLRYYCDACSNWQIIDLVAGEQYPATFTCNHCFIIAKFNQNNLSYP